MKILEYNDLDTSRTKQHYLKIKAFLERNDFRSAEVKKLPEHNLYRAKLDDSNRLLFKIMTYRGERYALMLEVILNHAYDKSKFLRGTQIDESKILPFDNSQIEQDDMPSLIYVNQSIAKIHILDKIISFDPEQNEIYGYNPPIIIIGPAGSGKTAITLEKMKQAHGQALYITLSGHLADNSRNIYYANNYENDKQEISFLSFREFLETMRVPEGREIKYKNFAGWLMRFPKQQRVSDAHRLYEEFRGVITGSSVDKPFLNREDYLNLGVRQSIFLNSERELVYTLFEKYLLFLRENGYYDPNILSHDYLSHVRPIYDFIVVDEVQDITNIQLRLILSSLKAPGNFILCGDSNQIVHPNFFSWSAIKSMFYNDDTLQDKKIIRILQSNFRNAAAITDISNKILKVKQKRFGSIDRESNYLMHSLSEKAGEIILMKDSEKAKRELNQKTRMSARFAVLVMRDEDKQSARQFFNTPLLFSIHEAKGLEYENVILLNFITNERNIFQDIVSGVSAEDIEGDIEYSRQRDKTDKSHEAYKFFINSLYVAVTRSAQNLYMVEADIAHPMLRLLGIKNAQDRVTVETKQSTIEEWQAEAHRLELQGSMEQAEDIRRNILKTQAVPWQICTPDHVKELIASSSNPKEVSQKPKKTLFEYALFFGERRIIKFLSFHGFDRAKQICFMQNGKLKFNESLYNQQRKNIISRYLQTYKSGFYKNILRECEIYGINYRNVFNLTPLMLAIYAGNIPLIKELLNAGADTELDSNFGLTAWQFAIQKAIVYKRDEYLISKITDMLMPPSVSLKADERLIKLDAKQGEFMLFQIFFAMLHDIIRHKRYHYNVTFTAVESAKEIASLPDNVIPAYRKKRSYISALLSKNEIESTNPYNKKLFKRKRTGHYILNPELAIRHKDEWVNIYEHANIGLTANLGLKSDAEYHAAIEFLMSKDKERKSDDNSQNKSPECAAERAL
ncbi:MAG: PhoH family protein [Nitrospirae bacterium]|nr:PhoH family protein [Nitrospirota bacterium]MCL5978340.1 PhoH family protein [Nitrospirota bacterium]